MRVFWWTALILLIFISAGQSISGRHSDPDNGLQKVWIFFSDKEPAFEYTTVQTAGRIGIKPRAISRRQKQNPPSLIDWYDFPVNTKYLHALKKAGIEHKHCSRWLNAVSAYITNEQKAALAKLPFVKKTATVSKFHRKHPASSGNNDFYLPKRMNYSLDYGQSLTQNEMLHIPKLHDLGITGRNVLILMLDTGFNYLIHSTFAFLQVVDEYDFINDDPVTQNEIEQDNVTQHNHGTQTLATIAGYQPGQMIGPAFDAKYLLAKTEDVSDETIVEEDNWVAGLEWGERYGADIASSSLGYNDWYAYSDLDGQTAITTIAADIAVGKGMVVINAMGNEGNYAGSIVAPADGERVIAVGAVTSNNSLTSFSSTGPTWDQRIKPDVVAMGSRVRTVSPNSVGAFTSENGTSYSCPQIAGVAALLLSAQPELTPLQVRAALRATADRAKNPDNEYGWGLVNAWEAALFHGLIFSNQPSVDTGRPGYKTIRIQVYSKAGIKPNQVFIHFSQPNQAYKAVTMQVSHERNEFYTTFRINEYGEQVQFYFTAEDSTGDLRQHPWDAPATLFTTEGGIKDDPTIPTTFKLYQNYPNPFQTTTVIQYHIPEESYVDLSVYNLRQQRVKVLIQGNKKAGSYFTIWNGLNSQGQTVAAGTYCLWLQAKGFKAAKFIEFIPGELLGQNHPNPFNQQTQIEYSLPQDSYVALKVYNCGGQLVNTMVDAHQPGGKHQITWKGINNYNKILPSGIYFYVLCTDGLYITRKMTILR